MMSNTIVIVGAGFSGTVPAANLMRRPRTGRISCRVFDPPGVGDVGGRVR
jgi:uncharacterized NAD(P)/FAD-binding protein YdhS